MVEPGARIRAVNAILAFDVNICLYDIPFTKFVF